jgi:hypothetical protein
MWDDQALDVIVLTKQPPETDCRLQPQKRRRQHQPNPTALADEHVRQENEISIQTKAGSAVWTVACKILSKFVLESGVQSFLPSERGIHEYDVYWFNAKETFLLASLHCFTNRLG